MPSSDIEIRPYNHSMHDAVTALVAETYPWLSSTPILSSGSKGFAALDDSQLLGFMLSPTAGKGTARIRLHEHAARGDRREIYRRLYAAVCAEIQAARHQVDLPADDNVAIQAWMELGFGIDQIKGTRELDPLPFGDASVRLADASDLEAITHLMVELSAFHSRPPMFNMDLLSEDKARRLVVDDLARKGGAIWVATNGTEVIGFMTTTPDGFLPGVATIGAAMVERARHGQGIGTALLARTIDWARRTGYERCAVGWTSQNLVSDQFWRSRGFKPTRYAMRRALFGLHAEPLR